MKRQPITRGGRTRTSGFEALEARSLLATGAFNAPDISGLIRQAVVHGVNTGPAVIDTMTAALEGQLTDGPLAELSAGTITEPEFETDVAAIVADYDRCVTELLGGRFPHITEILRRQGAAVDADLAALAAEQTAGLIGAATYGTDAAAAIGSLTDGPLVPLHSPYSGYVAVTQAFESRLDGVVAGLDATTAPLTVAEAQSLVRAYSDAYRANMRASLTLKPGVESVVNQALDDLDAAALALTEGSPAEELGAAVTAFDASVYDTTGLFGPRGPVVRYLHGGSRSHG